MTVSMFLYMYLEKGSNPILLDILAWSWGASGGGDDEPRTRRSRPRAVKPAGSPVNAIAPAKWGVADVGKWLEDNGFGKLAPSFRENRIDGEILLVLTEEELKTTLGVQSLGERKKLLLRIGDLSEDQSKFDSQDSKLNIQDISFTTWYSAALLKVSLPKLYASGKLHRAVLVCYTKRSRHRQPTPGDPVIPDGTAFSAMDFSDCSVTSLSTGGSGGEDRLTANLTLNFGKFTTHMFGVQECKNMPLLYNLLDLKGQELAEFKRMHGEKPDPLRISPGISIVYSGPTGNADIFEWGGTMMWSPRTHKLYPREFKEEVKQLLLCRSRKDCPLSWMPDFLFKYFLYVHSVAYSVNPLSEWPYPLPAAEQAADDDY